MSTTSFVSMLLLCALQGPTILCAAVQPTTTAAPDSPARPAAPPVDVRADAIPPRDYDAFTGTEFGNSTLGWSGRERQAAAVEQLLEGNVPDFLRDLVPVKLTHTWEDGRVLDATVWVMPDYLAIGSDDDFLYMPLTLPSATALASEWGLVLPTCKMVDAIYAQATFHFTPVPMTPGPRMRSSIYYLEHQGLIDSQRAGVPDTALVAGHKKDIVLSNRLGEEDGRIAIYGWHWSEDDPIQPLCIWHGARYADYSHGARMVWDRVWIGGRLRPILDVLADPAMAPVLTYEGSIPDGMELLHLDGEGWAD